MSRKFHHKGYEQFQEGLDALVEVKDAITVFGSARTEEGSELYNEVQELCKLLSMQDFGIITGGGPGLMEAANKGCLDGTGKSVGISLKGLEGERPNTAMNVSFATDYFFVRKPLICAHSLAYICVPGGVGTLDELFEVLTLMNTKKIDRAPIVLYKSDFWSPMIDLIKAQTMRYGTTDEMSWKDLHILDNMVEVISLLQLFRQIAKYDFKEA